MRFVVFQPELGVVVVGAWRQERFIAPWGLELVKQDPELQYPTY